MGFWDTIPQAQQPNVIQQQPNIVETSGQPIIQNQNQGGFNIGQFMNFMREMQGTDPNAYLQQMVADGKVTQEQINQLIPQAENLKKLFFK